MVANVKKSPIQETNVRLSSISIKLSKNIHAKNKSLVAKNMKLAVFKKHIVAKKTRVPKKALVT